MSMTAIKTCNCKHEYQDMKYGKQKRVFNAGTGKGSDAKYSCTVCGSEK